MLQNQIIEAFEYSRSTGSNYKNFSKTSIILYNPTIQPRGSFIEVNVEEIAEKDKNNNHFVKTTELHYEILESEAIQLYNFIKNNIIVFENIYKKFNLSLDGPLGHGVSFRVKNKNEIYIPFNFHKSDLTKDEWEMIYQLDKLIQSFKI